MIIKNEIDLIDFKGWSGAEEVIAKLDELGLLEEVQAQLEEAYPEGIDETELNDYLRFTCSDEYGLDEETEDDIDDNDTIFLDDEDDLTVTRESKLKESSFSEEDLYDDDVIISNNDDIDFEDDSDDINEFLESRR